MYRLPSLVSQWDQAVPSISVGVINYGETNGRWSVTPGYIFSLLIGFIPLREGQLVPLSHLGVDVAVANRGSRTSYDLGSVSPGEITNSPNGSLVLGSGFQIGSYLQFLVQ